jgi:hypothetical protein
VLLLVIELDDEHALVDFALTGCAMNYDTYFRKLIERESEAVKVPFRAVMCDEGGRKKNDCHNNVDYWVTNHPGVSAVRGWLFSGPGEDGRYNIMAHSVVDEADALVDITPIDESTPREGLRFLQHDGSEEEFNAMKVPFSQIFYPFMSFEEWSESQMPIQEEITDF